MSYKHQLKHTEFSHVHSSDTYYSSPVISHNSFMQHFDYYYGCTTTGLPFDFRLSPSDMLVRILGRI